MAVSLALVLMVALSASPAAHAAGLAIDGSALSNGIAHSLSVSLTTKSSPDVIYLSVVIQNTGVSVSSVTDRSSLTRKSRASIGTGDIPTYTWYAIASNPLSSDQITVTVSKRSYFTVIAFGISGADTSSPFDPNSAVPASNSGSSIPPEPSVSISTTGTNDMIIGIVGAFNTPTLTPGSGFTSIGATSNQAPSSLAEYTIVNSAASGFTVDASDGGVNTPWTIIADAVVAPGAIPDLPAGVLLLAAPVVTLYLLARKLRAREGMGGAESARTAHARRSVRRGVAG
jgi:hypothetical protein